jgi:hypothetical protein
LSIAACFGAAIAGQAEEAGEREARGVLQGVVLGDDQVFEHGHLREQADVLEGAHHLRRARDLVAGQLFEAQHAALRVVEADAADRRLVETGQAVEEGRLAGAVRSDDAGDLARGDVERQVVDRQQAAEAHRQALDAEQRWRGAHRRPPSAR